MKLLTTYLRTYSYKIRYLSPSNTYYL